MTAFLVFTVCAPHGAWGSASQSSATTAHKATEIDPSKSALVGLIGAALGLERARLGELARALGVSVRVAARPTRDLKPDFHTVTRGVPPPGLDRWSRFEETRGHLAGTLNEGSMLSRREYWTAGLWTVAVEIREGPWSPEVLAEALARPRWSLHAGRKACPLGLPPDPEVVEADRPRAALAAYGLPWERRPDLIPVLARLMRAAADTEGELLSDGDPGPETAGDGYLRLERRRDVPDPMVSAGGRVTPRFGERTQTRRPWFAGEEVGG